MKTVLVTGSNRGIGFEIARQFLDLDFRVIVSGRNEKSVEEAATQLGKQGHGEVIPLTMDVSSMESIRQAYGSVSNRVSQLDVLVNNAGILLDEGTSLLKALPEVARETLNTNAIGPLFVVLTFLPLFVKGSRVINVSSTAGEICNGMSTYSPIYSISKTTLNAVTCQLSHSLRGRGIAVNAMCPGWVRTEMGGSMASRSVKKGAETAIWLATEVPISETGKFWRDRSVISW